MKNNLFKHINEYFNTFNHKDYTIYVDGTPTEWCNLNGITHRVVWNITSDNNEKEWFYVNVSEIEAIRLTSTTMEIVKTNGKEYKLVARLKSKEKKAKELILGARNSIYVRDLDDALNYLDKLNALMDE